MWSSAWPEVVFSCLSPHRWPWLLCDLFRTLASSEVTTQNKFYIILGTWRKQLSTCRWLMDSKEITNLWMVALYTLPPRTNTPNWISFFDSSVIYKITKHDHLSQSEPISYNVSPSFVISVLHFGKYCTNIRHLQFYYATSHIFFSMHHMGAWHYFSSYKWCTGCFLPTLKRPRTWFWIEPVNHCAMKVVRKPRNVWHNGSQRVLVRGVMNITLHFRGDFKV